MNLIAKIGPMPTLVMRVAVGLLVAGCAGCPASPTQAQGDVFSSGSAQPYGGGNTTRRTGKQARQDDSVYCQQTPDGQVIPKPYGGTRRNIPCGPNFGRGNGVPNPNDPAPQTPPDNPDDCLDDPSLASSESAVARLVYVRTAATRAKCIKLSIGSIAWIGGTPMPFDNPAKWLSGPFKAAVLTPDWVVKTYVGLFATQNPPPSTMLRSMGDARDFQLGQQYRAMMFAEVALAVDPSSGVPRRATILKNRKLIDPGWTPPFDFRKFPAGRLPAAFIEEMLDPNAWAGERSPISDIRTSLHPNSTLRIEPGERVLLSGLVKFRAGKHTDMIGIERLGAPFHVPWVWNEFAITASGSQLHLYGAASIFPNTWWFLNGKRQRRHTQWSDSDFPLLPGDSTRIDVYKMKIYPALNVGAPAAGSQTRDPPSVRGAVSLHAYTAPSAGQWKSTVDANQLRR